MMEHGRAEFKKIKKVLRSWGGKKKKKKKKTLDERVFEGYKNLVELVWNVLLAERRVDDRRGGAGMTVFKTVVQCQCVQSDSADWEVVRWAVRRKVCKGNCLKII
jgi:hypothetical protein